MGPCHHPADPKARRQAFGKRAAQQALSPRIPALDGAGALAAKVELGVDVVLHQGHPVCVEQLHQRLLVAIRHGVAQGVLDVAHQPARLDGALGERLGQQREIDADPGAHRDLHHVELEPLDGLQGAVEGGGLHHHPVPRLGQHLQAEGERLHGAGGDDDLLGVDRQAVVRVAAGDGPAQDLVAGGEIRHRAEGIEPAHAAPQGPAELGVGEEGGIRHRHAQRHQLPGLAGLQHLEHQIVDVHRSAVAGLPGGADALGGGGGLDVVAGLGPGQHQAAALQQLIGLQHRHGAQVVGLAALADGGDALPRSPDAALYLLLQLICQLAVAGHGGLKLL